MLIGFADLVFTAVLHANGLITELNPLMKVFIERSEWAFAAAKGATLIASWVALSWYAKTNKDFVERTCMTGSIAYMGIWLTWFTIGSVTG